jgi:hypothetical protein
VDDRILEIVVVAGAALFGLVVFVVKDQLQAQRKRAEADAALAREFKERDAKTAEAVATAQIETSRTLVQMVTNQTAMVVEMRDVGVELRELGNLIRDRTPVQGVPLPSRRDVDDDSQDGDTPIEVPRTVAGRGRGGYGPRRGPGGREG